MTIKNQSYLQTKQYIYRCFLCRDIGEQIFGRPNTIKHLYKNHQSFLQIQIPSNIDIIT